MDNSRSCGRVLSRFFEYDTPQMLHTTSKIVGIMFRLLQLVIFVFIFAYYMGYKRGYQDVSNAIVSVTTVEPRAAGSSGLPEWNSPITFTFGHDDKTIIPTYSTTIHQIKSTCVEDVEVEGALCDPYNNHCVANQTLVGGNGYMTGRCVSSQGTVLTKPLKDEAVYYACEINGWCIFNKEKVPVAEVNNVKDMVLLIQSDVSFPNFPEEGKMSNYDERVVGCLKHNRFHSAEEPWCPLFHVGDLLRDNSVVDGKRIYTYKEITEKGGAFLINEVWDCNFDVSEADRPCTITYRVRRMDTPIEDLEKGHELKWALAMSDVGRQVVLIEAIRFIVRVEGTARKFNIFTLLTRIGASFGLFAIAAVVCEVLILFSCCPQERQVRNFKFVQMKSQLPPNKAKDNTDNEIWMPNA